MATRVVSRKGQRVPARGVTRGRRRKTSPMFVVHEHSAQRPRYELLVEAGGVLWSWAVPGGLSVDPRQKRLAMPSVKRPREYGGFEGLIEGGVTAGDAVIVWDRGPYRNLSKRAGRRVTIEDALENGHVLVWLEGEKLRGGFELTRVAADEKEHWIVVKHRDDEADARRDPVRMQRESVLSGRTVEQVCSEQR